LEITTERLLLREFLLDDWRAVLAYQQDACYLEYYPWSARTESDARNSSNGFRASRPSHQGAGLN